MIELTPSQEDYLEEIYNQVNKFGYAKVTEISRALEVKKSSVTGALNALLKKELITYTPYSSITLTAKGEELAKAVLNRHEVMTHFFSEILKLSPEEAIKNACKIEHVMSEELFSRMTKFSAFIQEFFKQNPAFKTEIEKLFK